MGLFDFISINRDIARRKKRENSQRFAQFGKFVEVMAHDVNNPLMVISGRAQLSLMEKIDNEELKKNLQAIFQESQRAKDIIQRILGFVRPSKDRTVRADINKSLEGLISLIEPQFSMDNVKIMKNYGVGLPEVNIDEKHMQDVFINLLNNSRDAMFKGGQIKVSTCRSGENVKITFEDTGPGMSAEVMARLFEPFFTTKEKRVGLGLSVSYSIVKAHGGELDLKSSPGKGTAASITLPAMPEGGSNA
ncbi:MAG: ATP-binding protein [Candidatus Omnitrophica bacterium]|jgi:signal transduction histidine kinase|nr:ATP-binding protein [Candidatus Omnitrophota bacterium]